MAFTLYLDGDPQETYIEAGESFRVQLEDVDRSSGYDETCVHCGEAIEDRNGVWFHTSTDHAVCNWTDESEDEEFTEEDTVAEVGPFAWCNSAAITLDPEDNAVHCSISVGDPRGAFTFTVRQIPTSYNGDGTISNPDLAGKLIIHTPYPGEGLPHMETIELRPGTLEVKS